MTSRSDVCVDVRLAIGDGLKTDILGANRAGIDALLITAGGSGGRPPIIGTADTSTLSDPLPQALALTAIVITFGVTAFLLALGYRSWQITGDDMVEDDIEDRFLMRRRAVDGPEAELGDGEPDTTEFEVGEGS
jgi:multicomponent Na+:H+ antiporter subunit C